MQSLSLTPTCPSSDVAPCCSWIVLCLSCIMVSKSASSAGGEAAQHRAEWNLPVGSAGCGAPQGTLVPWAARMHCWFRFNLLSARTHRSVSIGLLSSLSLSSLYIYLGLTNPRMRIWHLLLLSFMRWWFPSPLICQDLSARPFCTWRVSSSS